MNIKLQEELIRTIIYDFVLLLLFVVMVYGFNGQALLHVTVFAGSSTAVVSFGERCLEKGADVNAKDDFGYNPLLLDGFCDPQRSYRLPFD
ncbi:hypothetical protein [Bacteroidetes bacterium endosymbiont of Geopemphigus sp.]|uniref:hypothetical protein n=1 Tax=Bacteroidetes bacterium endosymbiont of Geopemphigus sp. TaxID=2047937 RepID=UPI000CD1ADFD|nr:hypothetical protein [Bacteroidetes bacterium endosymbiont of Geopemphigus sp.]